MVATLEHRSAHLRCKHFFAGAALYADGKICALLLPDGLACKLGQPRCAELISDQRAVPLCDTYGDGANSSYALFPEPDELDDKSIINLLRECISFVAN